MDKLKYWIFLFFVSQSLHALTTCNVTVNTDNNPGGMGDVGDLRYCLNTMNQNLNATPDDYEITFAYPMTIQLNGILPIINNSAYSVNITIGNSGSTPTVTIDGNSGAYSGFFIPMGNVTIQNMIFQNLTAQGGNGGSGIAAGGGGMGAGGAIYAPQSFLYGAFPSVTLMNVSINSCSAKGGNGGSYLSSSTGYEGGGGGGGFNGNGGSIVTTGITGGAGGGGFGSDGGDVTLSVDNLGGGGGGGGGIGSRATLGSLMNLGTGGSDQGYGQGGNGYGLNISAGNGGGGLTGGYNAGGGSGGGPVNQFALPGGGGGGSAGYNGLQPQGSIPPLRKPNILLSGSNKKRDEGHAAIKMRHPKSTVAAAGRQDATPSGGSGGDGGGGGGGGVVTASFTNGIDGQPGNGGYGGGGGGGAGAGAYEIGYTVRGGTGGVGGGGGGGGVNLSGMTLAEGGNSLGGGGGGGGGISNGTNAQGGTDIGNLGGGSGGSGANASPGSGEGGGGGGGGSGLGGAIFVDTSLDFTIQALSGIPTTFNTSNNTTQSGTHGTGGAGGSDGSDGSALGNSIFLRTGSSLSFVANGVDDLLTLGEQVAFTDDTTFGAGGTSVSVRGNGTVIYNGTSDYQGTIKVDNANFKVNGQIDNAGIYVCRNNGISSQKGTLSGAGTMTGAVYVNSGVISPSVGETLTLGSLSLHSNSVVHSDINSSGTSLVAVTGPASLSGTLEITLDPNTTTGQYTLLTSSGITGTFNSVTFTGETPSYTLSYLPAGAPTYVQLNLSPVTIPATLNGATVINPAIVCCGRPVILGPLDVPGSGPTVYTVTGQTGDVQCLIKQTKTQTYLKMQGKGTCTIIGTKNSVTSSPLTVVGS